MIKAAICDDEKFFVGELHKSVAEFFSGKNIDVSITDFESGSALAEQACEFDLIFLDVCMSELDGFEAAEIMRKNGFSGRLIFVTIMKEDMHRAFEFEAFDYLVKPLSKAALKRTLERFLNSIRVDEKTIMITRKNERSVIKLKDILYCEIINRKIGIHLSSGEIIEYYDKISELENKLGGDFFKSHRSYLVNLKHIKRYGKDGITLDNSEIIPLSRSRKAALIDALMNDLGEVKR